MSQDITLITLPRDAYHHLIFTLRPLLPPITASPEDISRRDHAAIVQVASLCPANPAQAALAAQYVAANAQAMECLRVTRDPATAPEVAMRCTAQAASMMRQAQGALRLLLRAQGVKAGQTLEQVAGDGAAWAEHRAEQWMLQALTSDPTPRHAAEIIRLSENPIESPMIRHFETDSDMLVDPDGARDGVTQPDAPDAATTSPITPQEAVPEPDPTPAGAEAVAEQPVDPDQNVVMDRDSSQKQERTTRFHVHETDLGAAPTGGGSIPERQRPGFRVVDRGNTTRRWD